MGTPAADHIATIRAAQATYTVATAAATAALSGTVAAAALVAGKTLAAAGYTPEVLTAPEGVRTPDLPLASAAFAWLRATGQEVRVRQADGAVLVGECRVPPAFLVPGAEGVARATRAYLADWLGAAAAEAAAGAAAGEAWAVAEKRWQSVVQADAACTHTPEGGA